MIKLFFKIIKFMIFALLVIVALPFILICVVGVEQIGSCIAGKSQRRRRY